MKCNFISSSLPILKSISQKNKANKKKPPELTKTQKTHKPVNEKF